jgi:hypothetical protein
MKALEKIQLYITTLEEKRLYLYIGIVCAILVGLASFIVMHYYSSIGQLRDEISFINEQRVRVRRLLTAFDQMRKHRAEVDTLFSQEAGFKIGGYFEKLLARLGLSEKRALITPSHIDHDKFRESILKANLTDINMKQLCELLNELDKDKRIYTKELEIAKSRTTPKTLDVTLTIATLEPYSEATA